jgi:rRNA-processing protein EBP2
LTLNAAKRAHKLLEDSKIPFRRPVDYFAEMLKSDEQMRKIKANLLEQKKRIESAEERKKQREMKKYGKKVQQAKEEERKKSAKQVCLNFLFLIFPTSFFGLFRLLILFQNGEKQD